ncbi:MAG: hypothetical protein QXW71_05930 [Thermoplasmata archaeon]
MSFTEAELREVKKALKQLVKNFRKIGIRPLFDVKSDEIEILVDVDQIVQIIKNYVQSSLRYEKRINFSINRQENMLKMVVKVVR